MYVPRHFAVDDATTAEFLAGAGAAHLVTATAEGLVATRLPYVWAPEVGAHGALQAHVARTNDQWRRPPVGEAMAIVHGPDAYVTPSWYATKAEHGRVVPTWNYVTAHVYGRLVVHDDEDWLAAHVRALTERFEAARPEPWAVDDAPPAFVAGQLRAVVGLELVVTRVEAKAKLSQNRSDADRAGVAAGFASAGDARMADAVRAAASRKVGA
ncbi:FMN-binding negative transcriptional regulator [Actinotalea fermentans]|uniref:Transcriptional regulator n=1 Tax=Actinotalea fermentans TaxID=43671 RepID=A0A511YWK3_9CELL|nr:FMN-binding negative transcriptional regulator [Actinotalea fermentans]KGM15530.1 transcriptional regulator [Actinotalea fermentans ATCC 43279 = JCM 9966 = DSM 3133]GEN79587.1 transcriptional regulator [Actinotalea fermentans]